MQFGIWKSCGSSRTEDKGIANPATELDHVFACLTTCCELVLGWDETAAAFPAFAKDGSQKGVIRSEKAANLLYLWLGIIKELCHMC